MLKIVIPDPGLREYGGHHPAMINAIANTQAVTRGDIELDVYCNTECTDEFIAATQSPQVRISKHFNTDFYQYFYQSPNLVTLNGYINQLTKEYLSIFEQYAPKKSQSKIQTESGNTLFLYHTLNAEHATALASAIAMYNKRYSTPLNHCVFLMFSPIKHNQNGELNVPHFLNFKVGFSLLTRQTLVKFFAAEASLQQSYQYLLSNTINTSNTKKQHSKEVKYNQPKEAIPIHPCGLLNQNTSQVVKAKRVILFTGDAKVNKGFLTLPTLIEKITKDITDKNVEFVVQYTITNNSEALKQTSESIKVQANNDSRIKLITRFWSHEELHNNFAIANSIVFNYDSDIYQNQSSGVLWLAAFYNLNLVFLTSNWLMREAKKLNCEYSYCMQYDLSLKTYNYLMQKSNNFDKVKPNNYRNMLFQDIGEWLLNIR